MLVLSCRNVISGCVDVPHLGRSATGTLRQEIGGIPLGSCDGGSVRGSHTYIYTGIPIYIVEFTENVSVAVNCEPKSAHVYCALRADQVERARVRRGDNHRRYDAKLKLI